MSNEPIFVELLKPEEMDYDTWARIANDVLDIYADKISAVLGGSNA